MMGVRRIAGKGGDGLEGIAGAARIQIVLQQEVRKLRFRVVFRQGVDDPVHDLIVQPGGYAHFLLLLRSLDGPDPIHNGRGIDAFAPVQLLQPQQKPGRPVFVHGHGLPGNQSLGHQGHTILGVVVIGNGYAQVPGLVEQVVDKEPVIPIDAQHQNQHPLPGLDGHAGKVVDDSRVGDQKLGYIDPIHSG